MFEPILPPYPPKRKVNTQRAEQLAFGPRLGVSPFFLLTLDLETLQVRAHP